MTYVHVSSRDYEFAGWVNRDNFPNAEVEGIDQCRSFIRNLCKKTSQGWKLGTIDWRELVAEFYSTPQVCIHKIIFQEEMLIAARLEGVKLGADGYLRIRLIGGVKLRKAILRGDWKAPVIRNETAVQ